MPLEHFPGGRRGGKGEGGGARGEKRREKRRESTPEKLRKSRSIKRANGTMNGINRRKTFV